MIQIQIGNDRVERVIIQTDSSAEEDAALETWKGIRDLVEAAHTRLVASTSRGDEASG